MRKYVFCLFVLFQPLAWGQIIEFDSMDQLKKHISKDHLIVFDIDNTIIYPKQDYGSDHWFYHRMKKFLDQGKDRKEALNLVYEDYFKAQTMTEAQLVENNTSKIIAELQGSGHNIMALTTRSFDIIKPTTRQLKSVSVDFSKKPISEKEVYFNNPLGVLFHSGILFTSGTDKGKAFNTFCDTIGYAPRKVIFINDKAADLRQLEVACEKRDIPFLGLRYNALDALVNEYTDHIAQVQGEHFKNPILSNEEAKKMLK